MGQGEGEREGGESEGVREEEEEGDVVLLAQLVSKNQY